MRRIISFLLIFTALVANAHQVSPEEAYDIAAAFFNSGSTPKGKKAPQRAIQDSHSGENQLVTQPYYIFNAPDNAGFVIISGDQRCPKILGYSFVNTFDFNNPIVSALLDNFSLSVARLPEQMQNHKSWSSILNKTESDYNIIIPPMLEGVEWTQGEPFNDLCPTFNEERRPVGCVGTAMSMILYRYKWPEKSHGKCTYTLLQDGGEQQTIDFTFGEKPYNWSKMFNSYWQYDVSYSDAEARLAIAELCRDCAFAAQSIFTNWQTGGSPYYVYLSLIKNFDYDTAIREIHCDSYKYSDYCSILKEELNSGRPILYCSDSTPVGLGAHTYVCDGYDSNDMFHFNFGWGDACNGFYAVNLSGILGSGQYCYCGIQPYKKSQDILSLKGGGVDFKWEHDNLITCSLTHLQGWHSRDMEIGYCIENINNGELEYYTTNGLDWGESNGVIEKMNITSYPNKDGEYIIYPVARFIDGEWTRYPYSDMWQSYVCLEVKNNKATFSNPNIDYPLEPTHIMVDKLAYILNEEEKTASVSFRNMRFNGYEGKINIPSHITYKDQEYLVNRIGERAFYRCSNLTAVSIPSSVEFIDKLAFSSCENLNYVEFEDNSKLKVIGENAFEGDINIENFSIPRGTEVIEAYAFQYHKFSKIHLPKSIKQIDYHSFTTYGQTQSENIYVEWVNPDELTQINWYAFDETNTSEFIRPFRTLFVPQGTLSMYQEAVNPIMIDKIKEYDVTCIDGIAGDYDTSNAVIYNISGTVVGNSLDELPAGIYIIKSGNTVTKKMVK